MTQSETVRLMVLCTTVLLAAKLLIDACLLVWVKEFMEKNPGIDYSGEGEEVQSDMGVVPDPEA